MLENHIESAALERQFTSLCSRLGLSEEEVCFLTGLDRRGRRPAPDDVHRETCIRLLLQLEPLLVDLMGAEELMAWLRRDAFGQTPLLFLATGPESMRGMIHATVSLLRDREGSRS
mgnify:CR=1 FL=1|jgi:hypothetical protein